jgi:putative tryptophan/tyrosine transport system substrate-binding protein
MDRREFISGLTIGLLAAPLAAEAQQTGKLARVGLLSDEPPTSNVMSSGEPFEKGLRGLGYIAGKNIVIEYRSSEGRQDRLPGLAADLVRLKVDVIVTVGTPAARAAVNASKTIPIVFARIADPVALGLVSGLGRPGGNSTGVSVVTTQLAAKRLEILKAALPRLARVGVLWNPNYPPTAPELKEIQEAARSLKVHVQAVALQDLKDLERVISTMKADHLDALTLVPNPLLYEQPARVTDLLASSGLPTMFWRAEWVEAGGLMSYGPSYADMYRRAATYVDKILKGAKPADLPVEQPTTFELVLNLKTAKALGLTVPPSFLQRADQVIE